MARRLTPTQRRHVVLLFRSGESMALLAHVYRCSLRVIEAIVRREGRRSR